MRYRFPGRRCPVSREPFVFLLAALILLVLFTPGFAEDKEGESSSSSAAATAEEPLNNKIELKRENTNRGQEGETTKSTFRFEHYTEGTVSLLRLDVPLVDKNRSFGGDLARIGPGDLKVRVGFKKISVSAASIGFFIEAQFPTASPKNLGSGVYELLPGAKLTVPVYPGEGVSSDHHVTFSTEIQQTFSLAGVEGFKDVNYTKVEVAVKDLWKKKYWAEFLVKPYIDWIQDGKTATDVELEIGCIISRRWSAYIKFGHSLGYQDSVAGTYGTRLTTDVAFRF